MRVSCSEFTIYSKGLNEQTHWFHTDPEQPVRRGELGAAFQPIDSTIERGIMEAASKEEQGYRPAPQMTAPAALDGETETV